MTSKQKTRFIRAVCFLSVATLVFSFSTLFYASKAKQYRFDAEIARQRELNELCDAVDNISTSLQKTVFCSDADALRAIAKELSRDTATAKLCLSRLAEKELISDEIFKFLSQAGAYTLSLAGKQSVSAAIENDREILMKLLDYSHSLSQALSQVLYDYSNGSLSYEKSLSNLSLTAKELPSDFVESFSDIPQTLTDYPVLIYDGPFSENVLNRKGGQYLKDKKEITRQEAQSIAAEILGENEEALRREADQDSHIPLYCFSLGDISIGITKKGGLLSYLINPVEVKAEEISPKEAVSRGKAFLKDRGYKNMTQTYYSIYDGVCTINFAYINEGIIHYSDLIKISVALDSGEVASVDASTFLSNHCRRDLYDDNISLEQAKKRLSPLTELISVKTCVIPLETGEEAYCYEFHCRDSKNNEALIYINKATGKTENILLLIYGDGGVLTK